MKIEFGSGDRPTPGFLSSDINSGKGVSFVGNPWELGIKDESVECFLALAVMEHLRFVEFEKTLGFVFTKLKKDGTFYFDVPDLVVWCQYYIDSVMGKETPFDHKHILSTLYGWQRWEGDEHKSGWDKANLLKLLNTYNWTKIELGVDLFLSSGFERRRMSRPKDAHLYVKLTK